MDYGMDTKFLDKHGVDMNIITKKSIKRRIDLNIGTEFLKNKRGIDKDMETAWNRRPPNSGSDMPWSSLCSIWNIAELGVNS